MKLLLKHDELDTNIVVDVPFYVPEYGVGCEVFAEVKTDDNTHEIEGVIISIQTLTMLDRKTGEINNEIIYTLDCEEFPNEPVEVKQDEIVRYIPSTNDFSAECYDRSELVSEADLQDSQDAAVGEG